VDTWRSDHARVGRPLEGLNYARVGKPLEGLDHARDRRPLGGLDHDSPEKPQVFEVGIRVVEVVAFGGFC
jgi:hypothetical protein